MTWESMGGIELWKAVCRAGGTWVRPYTISQWQAGSFVLKFTYK